MQRVGRWLGLLVLAMMGLVHGPMRAAEDFLDPEDAFRFAVRVADGRTLELRYDVAPGYYLYREQFKFESPDATLGPAALPEGKVKYDVTFGKDVESYRDTLLVRLPIEAARGPFRITVTSQGCADKGLCYPPAEHHVQAELVALGGASDRAEQVSDTGGPGGTTSPAPGGLSLDRLLQSPAAEPALGPSAATRVGTPQGDPAAAALASGRWWQVALVFGVAGVLLAFTPCVLPMLPILSSLIAGQAQAGASRQGSFALSLSYSLGMALVYTVLGMAAGWLGEGLAAYLQHPAVLAAFALMLVVLSLSMFGFYELQLPERWRHGVAQLSGRTRGGRHLGVFAMGGLSALIVSPCVAAPLAGALLYISQTRDMALGGLALFALAAGMSVPLLLLGLSAGRWLPRSGAWMEHVKHAFGVMLIAVALWIVQPVLPAAVAMLLWGSLLLMAAVYLRVFDALGAGARGWSRFFKGVGVVLGVLGVLQFIGAASGGGNPLQPLQHLAAPRSVAGAQAGAPGAAPEFRRVTSSAELDRLLASTDRPVMLDFYADWCVSCKEMEAFTFSDPRVQDRLSRMLLLKADVTANNAEDRALLKRFRLFGPPGTIFFDPRGQELPQVRVIGFQSADRFLQTLSALPM